MPLNKESLGGLRAIVQGGIGSKLDLAPSKKYSNTIEIENTIQQLSLSMLKPTFPGAISNDERIALERLTGGLRGLSRKDKEIAMNNLKNMYISKVNTAESKVNELTSQYGQPFNPLPGSSAVSPDAEAAAYLSRRGR